MLPVIYVYINNTDRGIPVYPSQSNPRSFRCSWSSCAAERGAVESLCPVHSPALCLIASIRCPSAALGTFFFLSLVAVEDERINRDKTIEVRPNAVRRKYDAPNSKAIQDRFLNKERETTLCQSIAKSTLGLIPALMRCVEIGGNR